MKLAIVGVGNAGSRIVNRLLDVEATTGRSVCRGNALVVNTARPAFVGAEHVPGDRRLLIGDTHGAVNGEGVGGDPDLGAAVARDELNEIRRAFDRIEFCTVDAVLVAAGLGGGTGSGVGAVVIDELQSICEKPVYALGTFPSTDEGVRPALNAARALQSFVPEVDNFIAFDNDSWHSSDRPVEESYELFNRVVATRTLSLLGAGELSESTIGDTRVDPSDIMRTLETGGISSIGYASTDAAMETGGILSWIRGLPWVPDSEDEAEEPTTAANVKRLVRQAVYSRLTLPCEISSAERVLILLSGPPSTLSRKGFENARYWLEREADTVEVLAGDERNARSRKTTATVLFSNVTNVPRIEALQEQALAATDGSTAKTAAPNADGRG